MQASIGLPGVKEATGERQNRGRTVERRSLSAQAVYNMGAKVTIKEGESFFRYFLCLQRNNETNDLAWVGALTDDPGQLRSISQAVQEVAEELVSQLNSNDGTVQNKDLQAIKDALRPINSGFMANPRTENASPQARRLPNISECPDIVFVSLCRWLADIGKVPVTNLNVVLRLSYVALYGEMPPANFLPGTSTIRRYMHALADVDDDLR